MSGRLELYVPGQPFDGGIYHYTECGLDNVFLMNGFCEEQDDEYGRLVNFREVDDLHRAIGLHVASSDKPLIPAEFRFLRKQMSETQASLARSFGVDAQTIANYEKGATPIPRTTDEYLRIRFLLSIIPEDVRAGVLKRLAAFSGRNSDPFALQERKQIVRSWEEREDNSVGCA